MAKDAEEHEQLARAIDLWQNSALPHALNAMMPVLPPADFDKAVLQAHALSAAGQRPIVTVPMTYPNPPRFCPELHQFITEEFGQGHMFNVDVPLLGGSINVAGFVVRAPDAAPRVSNTGVDGVDGGGDVGGAPMQQGCDTSDGDGMQQEGDKADSGSSMQQGGVDGGDGSGDVGGAPMQQGDDHGVAGVAGVDGGDGGAMQQGSDTVASSATRLRPRSPASSEGGLPPTKHARTDRQATAGSSGAQHPQPPPGDPVPGVVTPVESFRLRMGWGGATATILYVPPPTARAAQPHRAPAPGAAAPGAADPGIPAAHGAADPSMSAAPGAAGSADSDLLASATRILPNDRGKARKANKGKGTRDNLPLIRQGVFVLGVEFL